MKSMKDELQRREARGERPRTLAWIDSELRKIGYRLGKEPCRSMCQYITGDFAGITYPCDTRQVFEADSGLTFCNGEARRDANFNRLQEIRYSGEWFAVARGYIVEF